MIDKTDKEEQKKRVSKRLVDAFERERAKHGRNYSQKRFAYDIGLSGDSLLSVWMNGYDTPSPRNLTLLAAHPAIGPGIYDDMGLPRPMPTDRTIRDAVRFMEDEPQYRTIVKYLLNHPEKLNDFKALMEKLEDKQPANNHHAENGTAPV